MNWVSIGSGNGLSPVQYQAITRTNAGALSIGPLGTKLNEILIEIHKNEIKDVFCQIGGHSGQREVS